MNIYDRNATLCELRSTQTFYLRPKRYNSSKCSWICLKENKNRSASSEFQWELKWEQFIWFIRRPAKWFTASAVSPGCTPSTKTTKRTIAAIVDLLLFPEHRHNLWCRMHNSAVFLHTHPLSPWIHNTTFHSLMRVWRLRSTFLGGDISRAPVHTCVRFTNLQPNVLRLWYFKLKNETSLNPKANQTARFVTSEHGVPEKVNHHVIRIPGKSTAVNCVTQTKCKAV